MSEGNFRKARRTQIAASAALIVTAAVLVTALVVFANCIRNGDGCDEDRSPAMDRLIHAG